ncbi:hypothetical protein Ocin01_14914 [Orchesella cincta]|uniref:CCHC-type domain-containing protein n=1 Tax=Orchesella cincta TaxID=48709 RepID=A0A1D2MFJ7_ORCCI|nr:hypothetical protein Ocin01_14914 [Orchesella cincta]
MKSLTVTLLSTLLDLFGGQIQTDTTTMANRSIHKFGGNAAFPYPAFGTKRQRDLNPPSLASPQFDPMNIFRKSIAFLRDRDADSPAPKMRKKELPKIKIEPGLIRIKSEKELLGTSSISSDSDLDDEGEIKSEPYASSPPSSGSSNCRSTINSYRKTTSRSPKWRSFGADVKFTSTPSSSSRRQNQVAPNGSVSPPPFCFHCKRFGHEKQVCNSSWHYWWPQEMLDRHPWIRRKVRELRKVHLNKHPQYLRFAMNLDRAVEVAEKRKMNQERKSYGKPWHSGSPAPMSPRGRTLFKPNDCHIFSHLYIKSSTFMENEDIVLFMNSYH